MSDDKDDPFHSSRNHTQMGIGLKPASPRAVADPDTPVANLAEYDAVRPLVPESEFDDTLETNPGFTLPESLREPEEESSQTLIAASPPPPELLARLAAEKAARQQQAFDEAAKQTGSTTSVKGSTVILGQGPNLAAQASVADARVGGDLGGYHVIRKLAEGGMGVVYEAEHRKIGRKGAIKVLKAEFCQDPKIVERFYQEARAVNEIGHDNIVDIFDFGQTPEGGVFFVMEYLEGMALSDRLRSSTLRWSESLAILRQTIAALKAAHAKGFVHRDLKPDNIFIEMKDGTSRVKLLDFGIAKLVGLDGAEDKLTQTGSMIGTPHYMSPEQINGSAAIDHRTDIYSLGIIMFEMFSGATPFQGNTLGEIITGHLLEEPPRLTDLPVDLGVPKPIADIIHRMLAKKPEERYDSLEDVLSDLADVDKNRAPETAIALQQSRPMTAAAVTRANAPVVPAAPPAKSSRAWIPIAGVGVAAIAASAIWFARSDSAPAGEPTPVVAQTVDTPTDETPAAEAAFDYDAIRADSQELIRSALEQAAPGIRVRGSDAAGDTLDPGSAAVLFGLAQSDPSAEVRAHAASALGKIGHADALAAFRTLEKKAPAPLQPWYAQALHGMGDTKARKRLVKYAESNELAVAFKAALILAEVSEPGDEDAIAALTKLASREAELNAVVPYAGALLLSKLAALRSPGARGILYSILEQDDEQAQLAAAEGLARLGDDGGSEFLVGVVGEEDSPSRLRAAVTLVLLGDYSGYKVLAENLGSEDAVVRSQAAQGMGYLGEARSLKALVPLLEDKDWNVRVATAVALIAIVGLDPALLAQASVDWTRSALGSEDWSKRQEAAGVLGELPEKDAIPLLAQAIADASPKVRTAAARSARKLRSKEAARHVAVAALAEKDPIAQEEQVKALGAIGQAESAETLRTLTKDTGRVGVFAAGSLIAVGDTSGKARLVEAVSDKRTTIRLAAVEAAANAKNDTVVPVLTTGITDSVFEVRFTASEGLAFYGAEKALAVPVLESGLLSDSVRVKARAQVGLLKFGEANVDALSTEELLDSADPESRLAAIEVLKAQSWQEARPKVMRLVADTDLQVRRASVDLLDTFVAKNTDGVKTIYKSLTTDSDQVTRSKAQARLSLLVDPVVPNVPETAAVVAPTVDAGVVAAVVSPEDMAAFSAGVESLETTLAKQQTQLTSMEKEARAMEKLVAKASVKESDLAKARRGARGLQTAAGEMANPVAAATETLATLEAIALAAGEPLAEQWTAAGALHTQILATQASAAKLAEDAQNSSDALAAAAEKTPDAPVDTAPKEPAVVLASAAAALDAGKTSEARALAREARALYKKRGTQPEPLLMFVEGMLFRKASDGVKNNEKRTRLLRKSQESFFVFLRNGTGPNVARARTQLGEIGPMLSDLLMAPDGAGDDEILLTP
tara:strand:+ start:51011 stop:55282 length:4272 start_codon:yes stop_codon:yes gene_type:complete